MESCGEGESLGARGVNQPEDPWEVRERLIVYQPEHLWEVTERLLHRLVLRSPKATLEILRAYGEDPFRAIFGLELDCGKLWRGGITGSRCQPARGPVGGERTAYCLPARAPVGGHRTAASQRFFGLELDCGKLWRGGITESRCQPARGPVGGERTAYCLPARAPVGGRRTADVGGQRTAYCL